MLQLSVGNLIAIIVGSLIVGVWLGVWAVETIEEAKREDEDQ